MYKQYLKQAWQLMKQNPFFSAIYIIGTGLAISMVMVVAVVYHIRTANIAPEVNRDRTLYLSTASYIGGKGTHNAALGTGLVKECLYTLRSLGIESIAVLTSPSMMSYSGNLYAQLPGGNDSWKVKRLGTNDGFWEVYHFRFIDGKPYGDEEFRSGIPVVVISRSLAQKLFGQTEVKGQRFLLDEISYTVSGVVEDVSGITPSVYADLWVPYTSITTFKNVTDEAIRTSGMLEARILVHRLSDAGAVQHELDEQVRRYNTMLSEGKLELRSPLIDHLHHSFNGMFGADLTKMALMLAFVVSLFLLIPALNLSALNDSRMQERIAELGLRKAFGARRSLLFTQVFIENMLLMLPGGLMGLLFSYLIVMLLRNLLLSPDVYSMLTGSAELSFTPGMLMNFSVFGYAFSACLLLNLLSSMIPVWRAVRLQITEAINFK